MRKIFKTSVVNIVNDDLSVILPAYSKILNFNIDNNTLYIVSEHYEDNIINEKTFFIKIVRGVLINIDLFNYEYHSMVTTSNTILNTSTNTIYNGSNLEMRVVTNNYYYHIFVNEIKTLAEERDEKLIKLIDGKVQ